MKFKWNARKDEQNRAKHGDMRAKYDFPGAVRGKYYKRYRESTNVVVLEPDVARHFKNAQAVNEALQSLVAPSRPARGLTRRATRARR